MKKKPTNLLGPLLMAAALAAGCGAPGELGDDEAQLVASAQPSGRLTVRLHPTENVPTGVATLVTFGVPFPRGSVTAATLANVRVLHKGVEVPAYVELRTPWRHLRQGALDGTSVRVARIQIQHSFSVRYPEAETIEVEWGGPARTRQRSFVDPRTAWHRVTSGSFVSADNVWEPDVYALLPKEHLAKGMLRAPMTPFDSSIAETRDSPSTMDTATFPGYREHDHASKNFFYTAVNKDGSSSPYKTDAEPWLYDRASAMFVLYLRSGYFTALREAVRATDFYRGKLTASGDFSLKAGDPKYRYNECLAYSYWLTGDDQAGARIAAVADSFNGVQHRWSPSLGFWTERNTGFKLLANLIAFEVAGSSTVRARLDAMVADLKWHQDGAGGQLPANRIDGGLYHTGGQHDCSETTSCSVLVASPWMSMLIVDAMVRAWPLLEDTGTAHFIRRMGNFARVASRFDGGGQYGGNRRYPDYLMRADGTTDARSSSDVQHAIDVGSLAAWAYHFSQVAGAPDERLRTLAEELYATYDAGCNHWTRPGSTPAFVVTPPRKYGWEYRTTGSFAWALAPAAPPPPPPPDMGSGPKPGCGVSAPSSIYDSGFPAQTGRFQIVADATPAAGAGDTGFGVNQAPPVGESNNWHTAVTFRFNSATGRIDVRNGSTYVAAAAVPFTPGARYRLRALVDVPSHTYDAWVTPPGGAEILLGRGLAFRANYATASFLNNLRGTVDTGSIRVCDAAVTSP